MFTPQLNLCLYKNHIFIYLFVYHSLNSIMPRVTIVFFALVLVLFCNLSTEARHVPALVAAVTSTITTSTNKDVAKESSCVGVGKEECLMRRTLVAHLDYIYTQEKNP